MSATVPFVKMNGTQNDFVVLDLRSSTELRLDGMKVPGSIWFDRHTLVDRHLEIPRDRDVVLYCT